MITLILFFFPVKSILLFFSRSLLFPSWLTGTGRSLFSLPPLSVGEGMPLWFLL